MIPIIVIILLITFFYFLFYIIFGFLFYELEKPKPNPTPTKTIHHSKKPRTRQPTPTPSTPATKSPTPTTPAPKSPAPTTPVPKVPLTPCPTSIEWGEKCSNDSYCNLYGCDGIQYCSDDNKFGEFGYPCNLNLSGECYAQECIKCPNLETDGYCQGLPIPTYNYCGDPDAGIGDQCTPSIGGDGNCIPIKDVNNLYCIPTDINKIPKNNTGNIGDPCLIDQPASCKSLVLCHFFYIQHTMLLVKVMVMLMELVLMELVLLVLVLVLLVLVLLVLLVLVLVN